MRTILSRTSEQQILTLGNYRGQLQLGRARGQLYAAELPRGRQRACNYRCQCQDISNGCWGVRELCWGSYCGECVTRQWAFSGAETKSLFHEHISLGLVRRTQSWLLLNMQKGKQRRVLVLFDSIELRSSRDGTNTNHKSLSTITIAIVSLVLQNKACTVPLNHGLAQDPFYKQPTSIIALQQSDHTHSKYHRKLANHTRTECANSSHS